MNIGDRVESIHRHKQHDMRIGYVTATETYRTGSGTTEYVYVRWIKPCGEIEDKSTRFEQWELKLSP